MTKIVCYVPTYCQSEAEPLNRSYTRLSTAEIMARTHDNANRAKPSMYFDSVDSILNNPTKVDLVVADGRSTDSVREELQKHHTDGGYDLKLYPEKMSQWAIFNDIFKENQDADYFVYTSSDIIWTMDVVAEAIKEFEKNPKLQILFPTMSRGDPNAWWQLATGPHDADPFVPPYQDAARAPVCNAYVMIFRMSFLKTYGGYPNVYRNCYTESFLWYMCEAMGGQMMVLPRGHCFHWDGGDKWSENGSTYYYNQEFEKFEAMMNNLQFAKGLGMVTVPYLKKLLYKGE